MVTAVGKVLNMLANITGLNRYKLMNLLKTPHSKIRGGFNGSSYEASIAIPNYANLITKHYADIIGTSLKIFCQRVEIPFELSHFGLVVKFKHQVQLKLHDENRNLDNELREITQIFGPVLLKNVLLNECNQDHQHKAIFENLNFHKDRGHSLPLQYSLYYRSPTDPEQALPRTSSTLFIANIVAYLQNLKEKGKHKNELQRHYKFSEWTKEMVSEAIQNDLVLEQPWDEPENTGEVVIIYNRNVFHASHYRIKRGYHINVRYLE